jgi:elongator complex protein 4
VEPAALHDFQPYHFSLMQIEILSQRPLVLLCWYFSMSFRKRNVPLSGGLREGDVSHIRTAEKLKSPGVRPSPLDGRSVTSTGAASLDGLLAGHGGLALGCSLLIEEDGTTDYAGALIKFFAAEGLLQWHHVHVVGFPESWGRDLPGAVSDSDKQSKSNQVGDKMKIAWRYEGLGQFGQSTRSRGGPSLLPLTSHPR